MKLLIASDLHGSASAVEALARRIEVELPDRIILLGDLLYHGPRNKLPDSYNPKRVLSLLNEWAQNIIAVRGNCDAEVDQMVLDFPCMSDYALVEVDKHCLFLTHGHVAHMTPDNPPHLSCGSAYIYGHTHIKQLERQGKTLFINPGSTSIPKDGCASYATYDQGAFTIKSLSGDFLQECPW